MSDWIRARKEFPCAICQKPDWCTYSQKFNGWCCMRAPSQKPMKNGGYWHSLTTAVPYKALPKPEEDKPQINAAAIMEEFTAGTKSWWVDELAKLLKVSRPALDKVGVAWAPGALLRRHMKWYSKGAWAFPMRDGCGQMVGIRLRTNDGQKISVTGGRNGIFIPRDNPQRTGYILEGPTDLAAALTLGLFGLGRPSCRGSVAYIGVAINRLNIQRCVIIADNDKPDRFGEQVGAAGAQTLATELHVPVAQMLLPTKDLRKFLEWGGTRQLLNTMESHLVWKQPHTV